MRPQYLWRLPWLRCSLFGASCILVWLSKHAALTVHLQCSANKSMHCMPTSGLPPRDAAVADHVLGLCGATSSTLPAEPAQPASEPSASDAEPALAAAQLRSYIAWAKATLRPVLSHEAQQLLLAYYQRQRHLAASGFSGTEKVTIRFLEACVRLTQAHARLMARGAAAISDAAAVLMLVDTCAHVSGVFGLAATQRAHCACDLSDDAHEAAIETVLQKLDINRMGLLQNAAEQHGGTEQQVLALPAGDLAARSQPALQPCATVQQRSCSSPNIAPSSQIVRSQGGRSHIPPHNLQPPHGVNLRRSAPALNSQHPHAQQLRKQTAVPRGNLNTAHAPRGASTVAAPVCPDVQLHCNAGRPASDAGARASDSQQCAAASLTGEAHGQPPQCSSTNAHGQSGNAPAIPTDANSSKRDADKRCMPDGIQYRQCGLQQRLACASAGAKRPLCDNMPGAGAAVAPRHQSAPVRSVVPATQRTNAGVSRPANALLFCLDEDVDISDM